MIATRDSGFAACGMLMRGFRMMDTAAVTQFEMVCGSSSIRSEESMESEPVKRRRFLAASAAGAVATIGLPIFATAADLTDAEKANVKVVNDMCAAWTAPLDVDKIGRFLAEDCVFRASETAAPVKGRQAVIDGLRKMLGSPSKAVFEVVQTFARGAIVVNERFDRFTMANREINWNGVGVFYVRNGLIQEWSDYTIRMG
jgi:limonene-1,2-epoxide hydrolase